MAALDSQGNALFILVNQNASEARPSGPLDVQFIFFHGTHAPLGDFPTDFPTPSQTKTVECTSHFEILKQVTAPLKSSLKGRFEGDTGIEQSLPIDRFVLEKKVFHEADFSGIETQLAPTVVPLAGSPGQTCGRLPI